MSKNVDPKSSPKARGQRLKTTRMMAGLTRRSLEEKYGISASTIQAWEAAKASGLTERGVARVLHVLHQEGIACKAEWLLYGIGVGPQLSNQPIPTLEQKEIGHNILEDKLITQELLIFRSLHPGAVDLVVLDDGMKPKFSEGDYIAGICRSGKDIERLIGMDCIVQTTRRDNLFRRIRPSSQTGLYNLICINPNTMVADTTLYDQELISAAPVIWHRRRESLYQETEKISTLS